MKSTQQTTVGKWLNPSRHRPLKPDSLCTVFSVQWAVCSASVHTSSTPHPTPLFRSLISPFTNPCRVCSSSLKISFCRRTALFDSLNFLGMTFELSEKVKSLFQFLLTRHWNRFERGIQVSRLSPKESSVSQTLPYIQIDFTLFTSPLKISGISMAKMPRHETLWFEIFLPLNRCQLSIKCDVPKKSSLSNSSLSSLKTGWCDIGGVDPPISIHSPYSSRVLQFPLPHP